MHDDVAQLGLEHRPLVQPPDAHTLPQAPQFLGSVRRLTHVLLQVAEGAVQGHDDAVASTVVVVVVVGVVVTVKSKLSVVVTVVVVVASAVKVEVGVSISVVVEVAQTVVVVVDSTGAHKSSGVRDTIDVGRRRTSTRRGTSDVVGQMVVVDVLGEC